MTRIAAGEQVKDLDLELRRLDRPWSRFYSYGGTLVRERDGSPRLAVLHIRDVSAQKDAEMRLAREMRRQQLLLECSQALLDAEHVDSAAIDQIFSLVSREIAVDVLHFRLLDARGPLRLTASRGLTPEAAARVKNLPDDSQLAFLRDLGVQACVCHPLLGRSGRLLGTLCIASTRSASFSPEDLRLFETLGHMVAVAVERAIAQESLQQNVHEARLAHDELQARDARLRVLLNQLPITVWSTDRDLRINFAAGSTLPLLDGKPSLIGLHIAESAGPESPEAQGLHERALAGETVQIESLRRGRTLQTTLVPLRSLDEAIIGVLGLTNDITELATSQRALRETEEILRIAQRIGHSGSWSLRFDEQGNAVQPMFWSDGMYRLWGVEPGTPIPLGFARTLVHPDDVASFDGLARDMLSGAHKDHAALFRVIHPGGQVRHLQSFASPFFDERSGQMLRLIGMNRDVTEEQLARQEIERLNFNLEVTVLERTSELQAINRELESFAYAVSHDLRAPLRAMSGFSRALLEDHGAALDREARQYLDHIISASKTMGDLIDGLLTLSRYARGEFRREEVDLSALAGQILAELGRVEPGRVVHASVEPGLVAEGDPRLLAVVLRNLLGNAWKYSGRVPVADIRFYTEQRDEERWYCITDNGAGFSMAHANKLFSPFQRLHRLDEFPGLGIGLATVQRVVHRHGGVIEATGAPGAGATVRFTLPGAKKTDKLCP
jgi:PAS domain S-box-containing protein